jgi:hypothetical protein
MNLQLHFYRTDQADNYADAKDTGALYWVPVSDTGEAQHPTFENTSTARDALACVVETADCFDGGFALKAILVDGDTGRFLDVRNYRNGERWSLTVAELIAILQTHPQDAGVVVALGEALPIDSVHRENGRVVLNVTYGG